MPFNSIFYSLHVRCSDVPFYNLLIHPAMLYKQLKLYVEQTKAIRHKIFMTLDLILWKIEVNS